MLLFRSFITRVLIMSESIKCDFAYREWKRISFQYVIAMTHCRYIYMYVVYLYKGCDCR